MKIAKLTDVESVNNNLVKKFNVKAAHENINHYTFDFCMKRFGYYWTLKQHVKSVHENIKA